MESPQKRWRRGYAVALRALSACSRRAHPDCRNRDALSNRVFVQLLFGKPVSTFPGHPLKAPAQSAIGASRSWMIGQQGLAERAIGWAVPDFPQGLLRGIAQRVVFIAMLGKRCDATRQRTA